MKKTTIKQAKDLAQLNFTTSNFEFEIDNDYLDLFYDLESKSTNYRSKSMKSYGILDFEKTKFWIRKIQKLYEKDSNSIVVWNWIKNLIKENIITSALW